MNDREMILGDLAAAIQNVRGAGSEGGAESRRVRYALTEVYRFREQVWCAGLKPDDMRKRYYPATELRPEWQTIEALVTIHNVDKHGHALPIRIGSKRLVPGAGVFPSPYLYPGVNLYWQAWDDLPPDVAEAIQRAPGRAGERLYRDRLGGRLVLGTLWAAHATLGEPGPVQ